MNTKSILDKIVPPSSTQEFKSNNLKYNLSKFEYDLYHEEDDVSEKVVGVRRFVLHNREERWKILENNKVVFTIDGTKLTGKEREFLRTSDGVNFLIKQHKNGLVRSMNNLKKELKKEIAAH